jgi:hypothetical protein
MLSMIDPFSAGIYLTTAAGIIAMFIRIENRITRLETTLKFIQENMFRCQQPSDKPTT